MPWGDDLHRLLVEAAPEAIIAADGEGLVRLWNAGAQALFGHTAQEAVGQSLDLIIPERFRHQHWEGYDRALAAGKSKYGSEFLLTRSMRKDGATIYIEMSLAVLHDETGAVCGAMAVCRDVTRRRAEERALRDRLAAAEKELAGLKAKAAQTEQP